MTTHTHTYITIDTLRNGISYLHIHNGTTHELLLSVQMDHDETKRLAVELVKEL